MAGTSREARRKPALDPKTFSHHSPGMQIEELLTQTHLNDGLKCRVRANSMCDLMLAKSQKAAHLTAALSVQPSSSELPPPTNLRTFRHRSSEIEIISGFGAPRQQVQDECRTLRGRAAPLIAFQQERFLYGLTTSDHCTEDTLKLSVRKTRNA